MFHGYRKVAAAIAGILLIIVSHYALHLDGEEMRYSMLLLVSLIFGVALEDGLKGLVPMAKRLIPVLDDLVKLMKGLHAKTDKK